MKAIIYNEYGPPEVLQLKEVRNPVPKNDEVLIKVYASPLTFGEIKAEISPFPLASSGSRLSSGSPRG